MSSNGLQVALLVEPETELRLREEVGQADTAEQHAQDRLSNLPGAPQSCSLTSERFQCRHNQGAESRVNFPRRQRRLAVDPPVQNEHERRCDVPGDEIGWHPRRRSTATNHHRNIPGNQIREHVPQVVVHDDAPRARHLRTVGTTMLVDVFENRKAERDDLFECVADAGPTVNRAQHLVNAAFEEVLLVAEIIY